MPHAGCPDVKSFTVCLLRFSSCIRSVFPFLLRSSVRLSPGTQLAMASVNSVTTGRPLHLHTVLYSTVRRSHLHSTIFHLSQSVTSAHHRRGRTPKVAAFSLSLSPFPLPHPTPITEKEKPKACLREPTEHRAWPVENRGRYTAGR